MYIVSLYHLSEKLFSVDGRINDQLIKDNMAEMLGTIERSRFLTAIKALEDAKYSNHPEKEYRTAAEEVRGAYIAAMERTRAWNPFRGFNPFTHPYKVYTDAAGYALIAALIYKHLLNETNNANNYINRAEVVFETYSHKRRERSQQAEGQYTIPIDAGAYEETRKEKEALQDFLRLMF